ncbi:MAG: cupin domain-containing protein [Proteobacteria bacterium]|nr:cupin domain-containing protein [Pseudomonadota bacterium]
MSRKLQKFDPEIFIRQYWHKKPALMKQAFPNFESPITPEELAGLACESDVHSRLVIEKDGITPWQVKYGPFDEKIFQSLPETHYSLLVSECEKWIPELAALLEQFRFIPIWRVDDLMVSYAPAGGSVGPHSDEYDVFLLQAYGRRKWQYTNDRVQNPALLPDLDLAIMRDFSFDQETILEPGDMLYLPPGIAHHGIAIEPSMTISIGFRAPTASEVLESYLLEIDRLNLGAIRYADPELKLDRHFGEICDIEIEHFKSLALSLLDQPDNLWRDTVGKLLSDTTIVEQYESGDVTSFEDIVNRHWIINPDTKMLYYRSDTSVMFYCNGRAFELPHSDQVIDCIQNLCENRCLTLKLTDACRGNKALASLVCELVTMSAFIHANE